MSHPDFDETYADFMSKQEGDLIQLNAGGADIFFRVMGVIDHQLSGSQTTDRYLLLADAEEVAAQDGAEHPQYTATLIRLDVDGTLIEPETPEEYEELKAVIAEKYPVFALSVEAGIDFDESPIFDGMAHGDLNIDTAQAMQDEWDDRYCAEHAESARPALNAAVDLQIRVAALIGTLAEHELLLGADDPDAKTLQDNLTITLGFITAELLRLANATGVGLQEAYLATMAASERNLLGTGNTEEEIEA